jgi:molecular chaperone GrpE
MRKLAKIDKDKTGKPGETAHGPEARETSADVEETAREESERGCGEECGCQEECDGAGEGDSGGCDGDGEPGGEGGGLAAEKERYLRLAAEYDNFRKRSARERETLYADIRADTITKFLPVYDNLSRALGQKCEDEAFYKGVEMIMAQLKEILSGMGVEEIESAGAQFNPEKHRALAHREDPELGPQTITEEFEKGFTLGGKVIRFAAVAVAN